MHFVLALYWIQRCLQICVFTDLRSLRLSMDPRNTVALTLQETPNMVIRSGSEIQEMDLDTAMVFFKNLSDVSNASGRRLYQLTKVMYLDAPWRSKMCAEELLRLTSQSE